MRERTKQRTKEWFVIIVLLVLALAILLGQPFKSFPRWAALLTSVAFALLVGVVSRLLTLAFVLLEGADPATSFRALGMLRVIDPLGDEELEKRLAGATEIRILKTWFPETATIERGLKSALRKRRPAHLTLLLANPDSAMLALRSEGAGEEWHHGKDVVTRALRQVTKWASSGTDVDVRVGLYDSWPGCPVIWYDDKVLMGFYFRGQSSPRWPWVEVEKDSRLDKILTEQFESLWDLDGTTKFQSVRALAAWLRQPSPAVTPPDATPGEGAPA